MLLTTMLLVGFMGRPADVLAGHASTVDDSLLVSVDWLKPRLQDRNLVMVLISHRMDSSMSFEMIPGSVEVDYADLATFDQPVQTELPSMDSLRTLFEGLGISNESRVVIYSPDPIMAARAFVTLEVAGHRRLHVLNGGAAAWKAAGGSVTTQPRRPARRGRFTPAPRSDVIVDADWVKGRLGTPKTFLVDTRTTGEYDGTVGRRGMPSDGHLAGARLLLWQDLVDRGALKPVNELRGIYQKLGVQPGDTVVTYCFVGYRASFSYFVARVLGYESRFYDGSYQDWAHRHYPLTKGSKP